MKHFKFLKKKFRYVNRYDKLEQQVIEFVYYSFCGTAAGKVPVLCPSQIMLSTINKMQFQAQKFLQFFQASKNSC